jgi:isoleucyl-tRNA synthetase
LGNTVPIWRTKDGKEEVCIGSLAELKKEVEKSVKAGLMQQSMVDGQWTMDLHRPYVDDIILVSSKGEPMYREPI